MHKFLRDPNIHNFFELLFPDGDGSSLSSHTSTEGEYSTHKKERVQKPVGGIAVLPSARFEDNMDRNDDEKENQEQIEQEKLDYSYDSNGERLPAELDRSSCSVEVSPQRTKSKKTVDYDGKGGYFWGDRVRGFVDRLTGAFSEKESDKYILELEEIKFEDLPLINSDRFKAVELQIDPRSGELLVGQVDLKTSRINENKVDVSTGKLRRPVNKEHGIAVHGIIDCLNNTLLPGQFDEAKGKLIGKIDPLTFSLRNAEYDPKNGIFYGGFINGTFDKVTGDFKANDLSDIYEISFDEFPKFERDDVRVIELQADPKTGKLLDGQVDLMTGKINESVVDLSIGKLKRPVDKKNVKVLHAFIYKSNKKLIPGQFEEKSGKLIGRFDTKTSKLIPLEYDQKSETFRVKRSRSLLRVRSPTLSRPIQSKTYKFGFPEVAEITFDEMPQLESEIMKPVEVQIDPKTGCLLDGQLDLKTNKINENKFDLCTGRLKNPLDKNHGKIIYLMIDPKNLVIQPGQVDPNNGKLIGKIDPKTLQLIEIDYDPKSGSFLAKKVKGFFDKLTGSFSDGEYDFDLDGTEIIFDKLPIFDLPNIKAIELQVDRRTGRLLNDQVDLQTGKIIGNKVDMRTGKLKNPVDQKHGKIIHAIVDSKTMTLQPGQFNSDGKLIGSIDPKNLRLIELDYDPNTGSFIGRKVRGFFDRFTGTFKDRDIELEVSDHDVFLGEVPNFSANDMKAIELQISPSTGCLLEGQVDLKTSKLNERKFDLATGKLRNPVDKKFGKNIYAVVDPLDLKLKPGQFDKNTGKIIGKIDPKSLKLIEVDFDPKTGKISTKKMKKFLGRLTSFGEKDFEPGSSEVGEINFGTLPRLENKEVKAIELQIDPKTGRLLDNLVDLRTGKINDSKFDKMTGRLLNPVDKKHGKTIHAVIDTKTNKLKEGQFDPRDGKLIGKIDPKTMKIIDIDYDPKTGSFIGRKIRGLFDRLTGSIGDRDIEIEVPEGEFCFEEIPYFERDDMKVIELQIDSKTGCLAEGQIDPSTGKINDYLYDLKSGKLNKLQDNKEYKTIQAIVDPRTLQLKPRQFNLKDGKMIGRFNPKTSKFVDIDFDHKSGRISGKKKGLFGRFASFGEKDYSTEVPEVSHIVFDSLPQFNSNDMKALELQIDPKTGTLLEGQVHLGTGRINESMFDLQTGKLKNPSDKKLGKIVHGVIDPRNLTLKSGQFDPKDGKLIGKIDPETLKLIEINYDPKTGNFLGKGVRDFLGKFSLGGVSYEPSDAQITLNKLPTFDTEVMKAVEVQIDPKTACLLEGQINLNTGKIIEPMFDLKTGKIKNPRDMKLAKTVYAIINSEDLTLMPGQFSLNDGKLIGKIDPETLRLIEVDYDPKSGNFITKGVRGFFDRMTGVLKGKDYETDIPEVEINFDELPHIDADDMKAIELQIDAKTGRLLPGQVDLKTGHISEAKFDMATGKLKSPVDKKHSKTIHAMIDPKSLKLQPGQFDLNDGKFIGKIDPKSYEVIQVDYDPKTGSFLSGKVKGFITKMSSPFKEKEVKSLVPPDLKKDIIQLIELVIDPKTGKLLDGQVDPQTELVNENIIDLTTGKLKASFDKTNGKKIDVIMNKATKTLIPGQFDSQDGKYIAKIDPETLSLIQMDFDPKSGKVFTGKIKGFVGKLGDPLKEQTFITDSKKITFDELPINETGDLKTFELQVDPKTARLLDGQIDIKTGKINENQFDLSTGKLKNPVDRKCSKTVHVVANKKDYSLVPGQIDDKDGKITGTLDLKTFKLKGISYDPKSGRFFEGDVTGYYDEISGKLIVRDPNLENTTREKLYFDELPNLDTNDLKAIELQIDAKTGSLLDGQVDLATRKIQPHKFDLQSGRLKLPADHTNNKIIHAIIDTRHMTVMPGQFDVDGKLVGKLDQNTLKLTPVTYDPKTGSFWTGKLKGFIDRLADSFPSDKEIHIEVPESDEYKFDEMPIFQTITPKPIELEVEWPTEKIRECQADLKTGKLLPKNIKTGKGFDIEMPKFDIHMPEISWGTLPTFDRPDLKAVEVQIDPKTGCLLDGQIDLPTGKINAPKFDLKTGKLLKPVDKKLGKTVHTLIDPATMTIHPGQFDVETGKITGKIDPKSLDLIEIDYDPKTGNFIGKKILGFFRNDLRQGTKIDIKLPRVDVDLPEVTPTTTSDNTSNVVQLQIDPKSYKLIEGLVDSGSGKINPSKFDLNTGKLRIPNDKAITIDTIIDTRTLKVLPVEFDPKSGKISSKKGKGFFSKMGQGLRLRDAQIRHNTCRKSTIIIRGTLPTFDKPDLKAVEVQIDPKTGCLLDGQIDLPTGKINAPKFDLKTGKLLKPVDKKLGKTVHALIDPATMTIHPGQFDVETGKITGKIDPKSLDLIEIDYDPKTGNFIGKKIRGFFGKLGKGFDVDMPKFDIHLPDLSFDLPKFERPDMKAVELQIDPKSGCLLEGQVDLPTAKINAPKFDLKSGKLLNPVDKKLGKSIDAVIDPGTLTLHPGQFDMKTGKLVGKIDPKTLELIDVEFDPKSGKLSGKKGKGFFGKWGKGFDIEMPKFDIHMPEISWGTLPTFDRPDLKAVEVQIDPKTGCLLDGQIDLPTGKINAPKFDLKTGKLLKPVDKKLGKTVHALIDPATMTIHPGQFDVETGKITGKIDPKSLDLIEIDYDPKTGNFIGKKIRGFFGKLGKGFDVDMPKFDIHLPDLSFDLPKFERPDMKAVELQIDPKSGCLLEGQVDLPTAKINAPKFDLKSGKLLNPVDKKLGKSIDAVIDPGTLTLHPGQFDMKTGKLVGKIDPKTLELIDVEFDPKSGKLSGKKGKGFFGKWGKGFDIEMPKFDIHMPEISWGTLPTFDRPDLKAVEVQIDPKTGCLLDGQIDLPTGKINAPKFDLKTGKLLKPVDKKLGKTVHALIDPATMTIHPGQFDVETGKITGKIDPKSLDLIEIDYDPKTGNFIGKKIRGFFGKLGKGFDVDMPKFDIHLPDLSFDLPKFERPDMKAVELQIDPKSGCLLEGQVDLPTAKINAPKFDLKSGKLLNPVDKKLGKSIDAVIDPGTLTLHPGQFDMKTGKLVGKIDPKTLELIDVEFDPKSGKLSGKKGKGFFGKWGKGFDIEMPKFDIHMPEISWGTLPTFDRPDLKAVEVQIDPKTGCLLDGQIDLPTGKINAPKFDLKTGKLLKPVDKKLGKTVHALIDPATMTIHPGQFDVETGKITGKIDPKSLDLIEIDYDPKTGNFIGKKIRGFFGKLGKGFDVDMPKFDIHLPDLSFDLPKFERPDMKAVELQIDPKSGCLLEGQVDLPTAKINAPKFDLKSGKLLNPVDKKLGKSIDAVIDPGTLTLHPGQFDMKTGKLVGKIDPKTLELIDVEFDPKSGKLSGKKGKGFFGKWGKGFDIEMPKFDIHMPEISWGTLPTFDRPDLKAVEVQIDPKTGCLLDGQIDLPTGKINAPKFDLKTGKLLKPVDKKLGKTVHALIDPATMTIHPGQFDVETGKITGKIDPKSLDLIEIDYDPKTGNFIGKKIRGFFGKLGKGFDVDMPKFDIHLPDLSFDLPKFERPDMKAVELQIDPKSGCLLEGQVDLPTAKINAPKFDLKSGKLLNPVDKKLGKSIDAVIDPGTLTLHPGQFDMKTGKLVGKIDPKTLELIDVEFDPKSGKLSGKKGKGFFGKWGKGFDIEMPKFDIHMPEISWGTLPTFDRPDLKAVEVQIDPKTGCLLDGQIDLPTGKINAPKFDLKTGKLLKPVDKKLGKTVHALIDPATMTIHPGQFDVETGKITGKIDPKSLDLIEIDYDPKTGNFIGKKIRGFFGKLGKGFDVDMPKFDIHLPDLSFDLPKFERPDMKAVELQIDPKSGCLLEGQVDLPTAKINAPKFDLKSGKLLNPVDKKLGKSIDAVIDPGTLTLHPGQFDMKTGKLVGKIDPKTLELIDVEFDPKSGKLSGKKGKGFFGKWGKGFDIEMPKFDIHMPEISWGTLPTFDRPDLKAVEVQIDPKTGCLLDGQIDLPTGKINAPKFDLKTGKLLKPVDKKLGKTVHALIDPATMTIHPGQFDVETGKITGKIDPKSLDLIEIDYDPKTGNFIGKKIRGFFGKLGKGFDVDMPKFDIHLPDLSFDLPKFERPDMKAVELQIDPKS
ncbi:hypothetical protein RUM43_012923, partial [Polyplax serrata]